MAFLYLLEIANFIVLYPEKMGNHLQCSSLEVCV